MLATTRTRGERTVSLPRQVAWSTVGRDLRRRPAGGTPLLSLTSAILIGLVFPAVRAEQNAIGSLWVFVVVCGVALAVMAATPRQAWYLRLVVAAAVGAVMLPMEGRLMALWVPLSLLLAAWCPLDRPPVPVKGRCSPGTTFVVLILSFAALRVGYRLGHNREPLSLLLSAFAVALATSGRVLAPGVEVARLGRHLERLAERVAAGVVAVVVLGVSLVVKALVRNADRSDQGWVRVAVADIDSVSLRAPLRGPIRSRLWIGPVAGACAVVSIGFLTASLLGLVGASAPVFNSARQLGVAQPSDPIPPAYQGADWYPEFREDMAWVMDERVAWRPMSIHRVLDVRSRTVNVVNRRRVTWTPPRCKQCPHAVVWLYGGTAVFGVGQRDDHTIASELARLAYEDGVRLEVHNRGVPGLLHWRNALRFSWDLTQEDPPDVVLFHEGAGEVESELVLEQRGFGNLRAPFEPFVHDLYEEVGETWMAAPLPDGVDYIGWPKLDDADRSPGRLAVDRFERSRKMSIATAAAAGLPVRYYWQPSVYGGESPVRKEGRGAPAERREAFRGASAALPTDVVDLSDVVAEIDEPLFYDDSNHNEVAARIIAAAIWEDVREHLPT